MSKAESTKDEGRYEVGDYKFYRSKRNEPFLLVIHRRPLEFKMYDGPPELTETASAAAIYERCAGNQPQSDGLYHYKFEGKYA